MKKIITVIFILLNSILYSQVPCPNDNNFWLDLTPTGIGNTQSSSCTYAGDYNTFTACLGVNYSITVCGNSYNSAVTMYSNSGVLLYSQNNISGNGCETFVWSSTINGIVRVLVDRANCNTNSTCSNVYITQLTSCSTSTVPLLGNQNCSNNIQVCTDASFTGNSSGFGIQELNSTNQGCLSTEHQSSWYSFTASSTGTISLTITTSVDYDFAIWGPNPNCTSLGTPIRCSFAAGSGNTGLGNGATDNSEGSGGDRWVTPLNVIAGQTYILLIDNFNANSTPFTLDWTMSGGANLNCSVLPIELIYFNGYNENTKNILTWITASELNNKGFNLQHSEDASNWKTISFIEGNGTTNINNFYMYLDKNYKNIINYYRLEQIDFDNTITYSNIIYIDNSLNNNNKVYKITNLLGQEVNDTYNGNVIYYYIDGSYDLKFNKN